MNDSKSKNWSISRWLTIAFAGLALLFQLSSIGSAQTTTLTARPNVIDPAKLSPVVLQAKKNGSIDSAAIEQAKTVKVGNKEATIVSKDPPQGSITIGPPEFSPGSKQILQILDAEAKPLASGELEYQTEKTAGGREDELSIQELTRRREEDRRDKVVGSNWYYLIVSLMFLAVLLPFVVAIYRGTSGTSMTKDRPLGLPVGSFRAILAYSLVAYLGFYVLTSILSVSQFAPSDFLLGIVATVVGFYFGSRSGDEGEPNPKTGTVRGIVRQGPNPARGAIVIFKRSDDSTTPYTRISDVDGRFELIGAKPGNYKVSASLTGSAPSEEQEVAVAEGSDHEIEIVLKAAVPTPPATPTSGTVSGVVTKPDGTPADQASITLSQAGTQKYQQLADAGGTYKIESVAVGDYDAEATLSPHAPSNKSTVNVSAGGQQTVDLQLQ